MTDPTQPPEQPQGFTPPPPPASPTPGAHRKPASSMSFSIPGLDVVTRDGGAWALAAVVVTVLVTILADLIYAVSTTGSAVATSGFSSKVTFRVHLLAFTGWATLGIALALLVGVGLACLVRPSAPAPFRSLIVTAGGTLALAVAFFALVRAIIWLSYGHDYGVAAFVEGLATIPIAVVTAALAFGGAGAAA